MKKIILIDNYDSFTFNLYQYLLEVGDGKLKVDVVRNDSIDIPSIRQKEYQAIVLSPGPGSPDKKEDFGICASIILELAKSIPTLGVCLGHQGIGYYLGGKVIRAHEIMHGKVSQVVHHSSRLFKNIPSPFPVMRYHSLVVDPKSVPDCLRVTATLEGSSMIMGLEHKEWPLFGIQFHPESIGTPDGHTLLRNFLNEVKGE